MIEHTKPFYMKVLTGLINGSFQHTCIIKELSNNHCIMVGM